MQAKGTLKELKALVDSSYLPPASIRFPVVTRARVNEFKKLWELKIFADFPIAIDKREIRVLRSVLAAQSPVFATLMMNDEQVKASNKLEIKDCTAEVVEKFLRSLYTGDVEDEENALDMFTLACTFDVEELKNAYEKIVIDNLDEQNALQAFKVGNLYKSDEIIDAAFGVINKMLPIELKDGLKQKPAEVDEVISKFMSFKVFAEK
jgi:hypothetical protein